MIDLAARLKAKLASVRTEQMIQKEMLSVAKKMKRRQKMSSSSKLKFYPFPAPHQPPQEIPHDVGQDSKVSDPGKKARGALVPISSATISGQVHLEDEVT